MNKEYQLILGVKIINVIFCLLQFYIELALCPNDNTILIYNTEDKDIANWVPTHYLIEHLDFVSQLEWSKVSNLILSCSFDRDAFVWILKNDKWLPQSVRISESKPAICCTWNFRGNKFAVGAGGLYVHIGYLDSDGWVTEKIKIKPKPYLTCIRFDENSGHAIVTAGLDKTIRVIGCYVEKVDENYDAKLAPSGTFATVKVFNQEIYKFEVSSWVNSICCSQSGQFIYAACHDSTLYKLDLSSQDSTQIHKSQAPYMALYMENDNSIVCAGFDQNIQILNYLNKAWKLVKVLGNEDEQSKRRITQAVQQLQGIKEEEEEDTEENKVQGNKPGQKRLSQAQASLYWFQKKEREGVDIKTLEIKGENLHKASITCINKIPDGFSCSDISGYFSMWENF